VVQQPQDAGRERLHVTVGRQETGRARLDQVRDAVDRSRHDRPAGRERLGERPAKPLVPGRDDENVHGRRERWCVGAVAGDGERHTQLVGERADLGRHRSVTDGDEPHVGTGGCDRSGHPDEVQGRLLVVDATHGAHDRAVAADADPLQRVA
jgi:hypothetical protein